MDKKIAEWLGWTYANGHWYADRNDQRKRRNLLPNWSTDDSIAITLLPVLVERGYCPELYYTVDSEGFAAWYFSEMPGQPYFIGQTIAAAIVASVSVLAESI